MAISVTSGPRVVLAACVLLAAISVSSQQKRAIDCRRFVFAPICRGVAAKRADPSYGHGLARFLHTFQQHQRFPTENEVADAAQIATSSPEVKEMVMPVSQRQNNEQEMAPSHDSLYHVYMPRFPAPRPEYEY